MKAIFGLGNVGEEYLNTRHNVGFLCIDYFLNIQSPIFDNNKKLNALIYKNNEVVFVKPTSFMNKSGEVVKKVCDFYGIDINNILVIHDDIDQKIGSFKLVTNGGSGGQKGVESIVSVFKTKEFARLKIGIAPEIYNPSLHKAEDFVLKRFSNEELEVLNNLFKTTIKDKIEQFLNS